MEIIWKSIYTIGNNIYIMYYVIRNGDLIDRN